MYGFLKLVMYTGVAMGLGAVAAAYSGVRLGQFQGYPVQDLLSFGGLALVLVGFVGRKLSAPSSFS